MVDEVAEVTFKVIPGYAAKGRRFSHVAFKEVNSKSFQNRLTESNIFAGWSKSPLLSATMW
jgi:hypothetical protein